MSEPNPFIRLVRQAMGERSERALARATDIDHTRLRRLLGSVGDFWADEQPPSASELRVLADALDIPLEDLTAAANLAAGQVGGVSQSDLDVVQTHVIDEMRRVDEEDQQMIRNVVATIAAHLRAKSR